MYINMYNYGDEKNVIHKELPNPTVLTGELKDGTSVTDPSILIEYSDPHIFNYVYIPEFARYYFITDIVSVRMGLWEVYLHVDVLKTYEDDINECVCILENTQEQGLTEYINAQRYQSLVKDKTDIISFSGGLLENGEYILITAGG